MIDLITLHKTDLFRGDPSEIADGFLRYSVGAHVFHARVEMASARVVGAAKSLDARVKAIIQAVPYCFLESREHELGTV
jgi:hypothetical protein